MGLSRASLGNLLVRRLLGETHVRVLLHMSFAWNQLAKSSLVIVDLPAPLGPTTTSGTKDTKNLTSRVGVREPNNAHLQQRLALGLHTLQETRIREPEL